MSGPTETSSALVSSGTSKKEIAVRDPIHGFIRLDRYDFITNIVATPEFQRLRHVCQLGMSPLVYPAATHNRFSHSLGTMHVMEKILDHLVRTKYIEENKDTQLFIKRGLAAALLHDIGHGPLSHSSEKWFGFEHEDITSQIIARPPISEALLNDGIDPKSIVEILRGTTKARDVVLSQLVSSALDADRLDYLMRDAHFTGAGFGRIDLDRIIAMLVVWKKEDFLRDYAITLYKGRFSIESYILGRYLMYEAVYFHKATRSAEKLVSSAFQRAIDIKAIDASGPLEFLVAKKTPSPDQILGTDDHTVFNLLRQWKRHEDKTLADLSRRIYDRQLLKGIELDRDMYRTYYEGVDAKIAELAAKKGFDPNYLCSIDSTSDTPYTYYRPKPPEDKSTIKDSIFIIDQDGLPNEISHLPGVVRALADTVYHDRLYVPEEMKSEVEQLFNKK